MPPTVSPPPLQLVGTSPDGDAAPAARGSHGEHEHLYREALQRMSAAAYMTDAQGHITFYNDAAAALWGRRPELGELWCGSHRIFGPDGAEVPMDTCPMARALKEGRPILRAEIVVERPDGERRHVLAHPQPIHGDGGRVIGAINVLVDITELKTVQAQFAQASADLATELTTLASLHDLAMQLAGMQDMQPAL